ncbi:MAG: prepilin-type N-terminal cleavage/methylation domain-containing protein [Phycisphaeraceae bacterium]|nr:prepilin-type N-terminal cleavage/methylation domain-containing protein [Phycisphaeraceae bacterium]
MNACATRSGGASARGLARRGGFTFVEIIVVIVILTVVAGMVVPRLMSWKSREGEQSVRAVADMLTAAAKRDTYSTQRTMLEFGPSGRGSGGGEAAAPRFRLMVLRVADVGSFDPGGEGWVEDPLTPIAALEGVSLRSATAGVMDLDPRRFQIEFPGAGGTQGRPGIAMLFQDNADQLWLVRLPSTATRAEVVPLGSGLNGRSMSARDLPTGDPYAIDLDASGRRDDPW